MRAALLLFFVSAVAVTRAFVHPAPFAAKKLMHRSKPSVVSCRNVVDHEQPTVKFTSIPTAATAATAAVAVLFSGLPVHAASEVAGSIPSALAAYGHYLGLVLVAISLTVERFLIKPGMSKEDEQTATNADIVYGLAGVLVLVTGYLRVTQYGKGWEVRTSPFAPFVVRLLGFVLTSTTAPVLPT